MSTLLYFILIIIGFMFVLRATIWVSGLVKKGKSVPELGGELGKRIKTGGRFLLYFYSPSCGACRAMTPVIEKMQTTRKNVIKVNVMKDADLARQLGIMGTPATVVIENSRIDRFILGARSESFLKKLI